MKLSLIAVAMIAATWLAVGDSPRVRSMEQRVSELEQIVVLQSQQLAAQQGQLENINWMMYMDGEGCINLRGNLAVLGEYVIAKKVYYTQIFQY